MVQRKVHNSSFEEAFQKIITFLEKEKTSYFVLGGLAVGVMGEPRFTSDIDLNIFINHDEIGIFLKRLKTSGFQFSSKQAMLSASEFGSFRAFYRSTQIDFIIASTDFENAALKRKKKMALFGKKTFFPSPEDLVLLKLIPARPKDLVDAESIYIRQKGKLDISYLKKWANLICASSESYRVLDYLKNILALKP